LWFEKHAESHINSSWPVIHISRIPAHSNLAISGGTHRYHLSRMNRRFYGPFHWMKIQHEQKCYSLTKKVIAHSALIAEEIAEGYQIPRERIRTIYPPVDSEKFSLNAREKRQYYRHKWGVTDGQFVLVFPSGDHQRKGADLILKALELADPRVRLAVAGRKSIDHERVINLGFQSDMPGVYAAADAAILASGYEPFGLVGPEAILCGTPVLLAETIGATEVLSAPACFKFSRTVDGLARLLEQVLVLFDSGQWVLTDPEKYIHYSYQIDEHIDDVLRELK
jgi:glycosyltransferase involved in cell wall biosynthesis